MKKTLSALLTAAFLLTVSSCTSENEISFENASGSRSNGRNFTEGQLSYSEDCIYSIFVDGVYEYDAAGKTVTKVADFAKIDENIKPYGSAIAYIPGHVVIASPSPDSQKYDESDDTLTYITNLYVTNLKGELKEIVPVEYRKKVNDYEGDKIGIEGVFGFFSFFMIDKGWVYGLCTGGKVRYNLKTKETQFLGTDITCVAGDYIYYETFGEICRMKENDISQKEEMKVFKGTSMDGSVYGDELANRTYISADGTILCRKQIYSKGDKESNYYDYWKNEKWYSFKFGEEPAVIGNGFSNYDNMYYAKGDYYAVNLSYENSEIGQRPKSVQLIKINGKTFEEEILFDSGVTGARLPVIVNEKFIILDGDRESAKIYNIETGEVIDCTL